jgi:trehalose-6-phosphatase
MTTASSLRQSAAEHPAWPGSEARFYSDYDWVLNPFLTIREAEQRIRAELSRLGGDWPDWQQTEIRLNVMLLACLVSDIVDDYLLGVKYDFSRATNVFAPSRMITGPANNLLELRNRARSWSLRGLSAWRDQWEDVITAFANADPGIPDGTEAQMLGLLEYRFPSNLLCVRARIPAAFRSQDLTHFDIHELGRKFVTAYPETDRPALVVGLRTAGSYFAPLLRAFLKSHGYRDVAAVTLRPKVGVGNREHSWLRERAAAGAVAIVIDEPVYSASTVSRGLDCLRAEGFRSDRLIALFPVHPHKRDWCTGEVSHTFAEIPVLTLEPEEWHKASLLGPESVRARLAEYFPTDDIRVQPAEGPERVLEANQEPGFHCRLKRAYEVELRGRSPQKRIVLAKSVGWGWLGYHAFLAGNRLQPHVPRILGLRDGIAYSDWVVPENDFEPVTRQDSIASAAAYVAARVDALGLTIDPVPEMAKERRHRGTEELAGVLSGAFHSKISAVLRRPRIEEELARLSCDRPVLIDGKMRREEWIAASGGLLKTDFEHHGMGKHQLNITDPAYDLAETILYWKLTHEEERELIDEYIQRSGDRNVLRRLFLNKLLAGSWAMARAADGLKDPAQLNRHAVFHDRYLAAWSFLVIQTARFCARLVHQPATPRWVSPLAVLDVDGVIDKQIFGFPSSTAAGIEAISILASHGFAIALNTARPVRELKEYCRAYGFVGGVAEYGAYAWDAVNDREQVLADGESLDQMAALRDELRRLPGVFVNDECRYSVRAYTFARGTTIPIPEMQVQALLRRLGLDRLRVHQTFTDTTVTALETDKGKGLKALLSLSGCTGAETIAVGDTEPDLAMFRVATRCFAPGHISCLEPARRLGCRIAEKAWQPGLLEIARHLAHPNKGSCSRCAPVRPPGDRWDDLFFKMLCIADRNPARFLAGSVLHLKALVAFEK